MSGPNPSGLCMCGCGEPTAIAAQSQPERGIVAGEHKRFLRGHNARSRRPRWEVDPESGCWIWMWSRLRSGYGRVAVRTAEGKTEMGLAHRWMYERAVGPIPAGYVIDHLCCNPSCVNPAHLEVVTQAENVHRGRATKLTADDVELIRNSPEPHARLAAQLGVHVANVRAIRRNASWVVAA